MRAGRASSPKRSWPIPGDTVILVFRPGMELLPLFVEAIALLPPSRRWDVEFSTFFATLPPGVSCSWRGMIEGSPETEAAMRLPGAGHQRWPSRRKTRGTRLVRQARTGEPPEATGAGEVAPSKQPRGSQAPARTQRPSASPSRMPPPGNYEVVPPIGSLDVSIPPPSSLGGRRGSRNRGLIWAIVGGVIAASVAGVVAAVVFLFPQFVAHFPIAQTETPPKNVASPGKPAEPGTGRPGPEAVARAEAKVKAPGREPAPAATVAANLPPSDSKKGEPDPPGSTAPKADAAKAEVARDKPAPDTKLAAAKETGTAKPADAKAPVPSAENKAVASERESAANSNSMLAFVLKDGQPGSSQELSFKEYLQPDSVIKALSVIPLAAEAKASSPKKISGAGRGPGAPENALRQGGS